MPEAQRIGPHKRWFFRVRQFFRCRPWPKLVNPSGNISSLLGLHAGVIAINDNATNAPQLVPLRARFVDCSKKTARCDNLTPTAEVNCQ